MSRAWRALLHGWGSAGLPSSRLGNRLIANVAAIGLFAALAITLSCLLAALSYRLVKLPLIGFFRRRRR